MKAVIAYGKKERVRIEQREAPADLFAFERILAAPAALAGQRHAGIRFVEGLPRCIPKRCCEIGCRALDRGHSHDEAAAIGVPVMMRGEQSNAWPILLSDHIRDTKPPRLDARRPCAGPLRRTRGRLSAAAECGRELLAIARHGGRKRCNLNRVLARAHVQKIETSVAGAEQHLMTDSIQSAAPRCDLRNQSFERGHLEVVERRVNEGALDLEGACWMEGECAHDEYKCCSASKDWRDPPDASRTRTCCGQWDEDDRGDECREQDISRYVDTCDHQHE